MIQNIIGNGNELLKMACGKGISLDKIGGLAKAKGLDGNFADKLGQMLKKYDKNNDGSINLAEAKESLGDLKQKLGMGGSGATLEQLEAFKNTAVKDGATSTQMLDGIIAGFKTFDSNGNNKLSTKELKSAINTYKSVMQA